MEGSEKPPGEITGSWLHTGETCDKVISSALASHPPRLCCGTRQGGTDTFISKIYGFVMAEMSVKLRQRKPQRPASGQEMTNQSVLPYSFLTVRVFGGRDGWEARPGVALNPERD